MKRLQRCQNRSSLAPVSFSFNTPNHLYVFIYVSGSFSIETRKTYRAVLSEPKLVVPHGDVATHATHSVTEEETPQPLPTSTSMSRLKKKKTR